MARVKKPKTEVDRLVAGLYTAEEKKDMVEWAEEKAMEAKLREQEERAAERLYRPPSEPPTMTEEERIRLAEAKGLPPTPWTAEQRKELYAQGKIWDYTVVFECPDGATKNVGVPAVASRQEAERLAKIHGSGIRGCSVKDVKEAKAVA